MRLYYALILLACGPACADTLVAARTIRANQVITAQDLAISDMNPTGALTQPEQAIGQETRVILYAGRPIRPGDIRPPAVIERNQLVTLHYRQGGLVIAADARSLARAAVGDTLRVMNLASRTTVTGTVTQNGAVIVDPHSFP
ncbi:flagellar basal body P-ring formation chaperone FlgA [Actibacterium lipolyticum]|uniref:Flagella basal body P-ring formation protein FlgA n=1 Tax=Actibacterium lipolyticum TaxID=1524263 RepID=A0A238KXQ6_9RHOB|nr:flagellar basal body P-ring formation chaperone FlgA [Actibacterium lipolyticum]SMX47420.1 flagellar basal body P-ring biosynthesis protein FlgA [Actibacterium lipolyticum]